MGMLPPDITGLPEWAQSRLRWLEQREENMRAEIATLRGARSVEDVREMLCEASCVDVTDERCARIWSLLEHPATTMTTLAVIADERGESYARARAEVAALQSRLAAAESECRAREEVQARLIRERNAAEAEAGRARGLLVVARAWVGVTTRSTTWEQVRDVVARIDAHLAGLGGKPA